MFVMCCLAAVIPLSLLGFVKPQYDNEEQFEEEEKLLGTSNVSDWPTGLYFALLSGILIGLVNSVLVRWFFVLIGIIYIFWLQPINWSNHTAMSPHLLLFYSIPFFWLSFSPPNVSFFDFLIATIIAFNRHRNDSINITRRSIPISGSMGVFLQTNHQSCCVSYCYPIVHLEWICGVPNHSFSVPVIGTGFDIRIGVVCQMYALANG